MFDNIVLFYLNWIGAAGMTCLNIGRSDAYHLRNWECAPTLGNDWRKAQDYVLIECDNLIAVVVWASTSAMSEEHLYRWVSKLLLR